MKAFITPSQSTQTNFSNEEMSIFYKLIKALAAGDFVALDKLLPADNSPSSRSLTLHFDAFIRNIEQQALPLDVKEAIGQQISMSEFVKKML
ncbi:MAG: hypothetical protein AB7I18_10340 [Candidatus Berkiella sp.]